MAAQSSRDVRKDDVAVVELYGKRGARKNLFDAAVDFQRRFLIVFGRVGLGDARIVIPVAVTSSDNECSFLLFLTAAAGFERPANRLEFGLERIPYRRVH